ncbi:protein kinase domain-containing protein [Mesobacillus harenae]|uniref:protein kinase domain-containing protein n=1 Tax=Mesobacillus harenae TaxID=2213203 RepID=UPI0015801BF4|nr:serine/threonine-protein kinase [Mesobacillus harenae]
MMNHSLKSLCKVSPGTPINGKWHGNQYKIIKELGYGANGIVYLTSHNGVQVALKMSDNGMSITSEVNVLKSFAKVQGSTLGPVLLDVDDWMSGSDRISFYVMEYIKGPDLLTFIHQRGESWISVIVLQLLSDLQKMHENGWVFGDLKPENLIIMGPPPRIRCIDVGGTTINGRAIKEFTEFFDRGYWGLGSRKADPSYDLFAVGMIMLNIAYPKRFTKTTGGMDQLKLMIEKSRELSMYKGILYKALNGQFSSAVQMRGELLQSLQTQQTRTTTKTKTKPSPQRQHNVSQKTVTRQAYRKKSNKGGIIETLIVLSVISMLYFLYIWLSF